MFQADKSETLLVDALDEVCDQLYKYNVHKDRKGSLRFAKPTTKEEESKVRVNYKSSHCKGHFESLIWTTY